ncbi:rRNA maturation RNase YbeY [Cecembia lonarensis]|uniref:Endoribonuclease YbeY n=1 Tax=Cecembia lonarensis (strain CCUG 58316 / KCTC 22772 / LW9) TaxID=1225176 RepID=K1LG38_CECL9|nr:rRNA maturation RNase YbeY [Cecembia lonarensis]EKB49213.1 putative rRNA maturation factor [Cecembia lonarensis LW9]
MAILFFEEDIRFPLKGKNKYKNWLRKIASDQNRKIKELNYIFCSDEYLYQINVEYLNHKTYTDIITFDNTEDSKTIEGDIFISIERVRENAEIEKIDFEKELLRVMSHGLLHLMGYKDKNQEDQIEMRKMENKSIGLFSS